MKYNSSFVPLISFLLFFSVNSYSASSVEDEFSMCAAAALESRLSDEAVIHVDLSELHSIEIGYPVAASSITLDLTLTDSISGEEVGDVVCVLDRAGNVVSSSFEETLVEVAVN